jgi:hypothetical protein
MPDVLNKATCYRKLAEDVVKRAECVANRPIRRHYCEIANNYLAAARAELVCGTRNRSSADCHLRSIRAHHCAFSAGLLNLFRINHSSGRGLHAAEPNDVQWPFWPRYGCFWPRYG